MGLFMAVASATWGHGGFFTPFYRIAAVLDPAAYDISLEQAATGSRFWLEAQSGLPGACVHLGLASFFGMLFGLVWRRDRQTRFGATVLAGAGWGLLVAVVMIPVLRFCGQAVGGGGLIADAPSSIGWPTYVAMHLVYGLSLGAIFAFRAAHPRRT
ncbi:MAG TPA: hypothetical protein VID07_02445 [Actinomycetes bacterium]|jgi:hypothetical protein